MVSALLLVMWFPVALATKSQYSSPDRAMSAIGDPLPSLLDHLWFGRRQHECPPTLWLPPPLLALEWLLWCVVWHRQPNRLNLRVLTGLRPPSVTHNPQLPCRISCGWVAANISALPLSHLPHISVPLCVCCGVWSSVLLCESVFIRSQPQVCCYDVCVVYLGYESH